MIIAVPNHTSYDGKFYKGILGRLMMCTPSYFSFLKNGMKKLFNTENWKLEKIKPLLLDSYYISILSEKYKKNPLFFIFGGIRWGDF